MYVFNCHCCVKIEKFATLYNKLKKFTKNMKMLKILVLSTLSLCPVFVLAQKMEVVEATGVGSSEKSALKDAYRNAVSQVVNTLVEAETVIKNEELIEDNIIAVSGGFIESSEIIEPATKSEQGFYSVKIKATVKYDKLSEEISHYSSSRKKINMSSIKSKIEKDKVEGENKTAALEAQQEEMGDFILKSIDDYVKLWRFEIADVLPVDGENALMIEVSKVLEKDDFISTYVNLMDKKFKEMGIIPVSRPTNNLLYFSLPTPTGAARYQIDLLSNAGNGRPQPKTNNGKVVLAPNSGGSYKKFVYDKFIKEIYILRLSLENANGDIMSSVDIALNYAIGAYNSLGLSVGMAGSIPVNINPTFTDTTNSNVNIRSIAVSAPGGILGKDSKHNATKSFKVPLYKPNTIDDVASASVKLLKVDAKSRTATSWR